MIFHLITFTIYDSQFTWQTNDVQKARAIIEKYMGFVSIDEIKEIDEPLMIYASVWF